MTDAPTRETTLEERFKCGECPVCNAKHGESCHAEVGIHFGRHVNGSALRTGEGAHLARLQRAPMVVQEVAVR